MVDGLSKTSEAMAAVVERVSASVVRLVQARHPGSGVVWSAEGLVVTSLQAIGEMDTVSIQLPEGAVHEADVMGRDATTDLALLRLKGVRLAPPLWSEGTSLRVGNLVFAMGRAANGPRASLGIVSALNDEWHTRTGGRVDRYIETDLRLPRGVDGGPLVSADGEVLGIVSVNLLRNGAILPTSTVRRVVTALHHHGFVRRGYLGITVHKIRLSRDQGTEQSRGLLLTSVEPGGPAEDSGLMLGDVLLSLGPMRVESVDDLMAAFSEFADQEVPGRILRTGLIMEVTVRVGERRRNR